MHSTSPVSYEHPRRTRAVYSPADKGSPYRPDQYHFLDSRITRLEEAVSRMESSLSKKFDSMNSRIDKCSELSVASSRAVAAVSAQLENFKNEQQKGSNTLNTAMKEIRTTTTKLCSDSQSATMRAMEELTTELSRRIESNAECIDQIRHDQENLVYEQSKLLEVVEKELENVNLDISMMGQRLEETRNLSTSVQPDHAFKEEIGTISEFICKSMLGDLEERLTNRCNGLHHQLQDTQWKTKEKLDHIQRLVADTESEFSKKIENKISTTCERISQVETRITDLPLLDALKRDMEGIKHQLEKLSSSQSSSSSPNLCIDPATMESIVARIDEINACMSELTAVTLPRFVKEMDASLVSAEYKTEQRTVQLLEEMCVEFDTDINRLVELVHSVYVQANLAMPPGTLTSWKKFKEIMFDSSPRGGRKPILGEAVLNHLATPRSGSVKKPPGRLTVSRS